MRATIMAPESTSPAKTVAMRACGATVELIPGSRQATSDAAVARAESVFYASHNWHPFFLHGTKTLAYELWEDLGFSVPDNIITPCGAGSNVLGCGIGFDELLRAGQIDRMPRIFASQPAMCGPIAASFLAGVDTPVDTPIAPTIAEGTAIAQPIRLREVLGTLRATWPGYCPRWGGSEYLPRWQNWHYTYPADARAPYVLVNGGLHSPSGALDATAATHFLD